MNRTALTLAAVAALTLGLAAPAAAAPPVPSPGAATQSTPTLSWYYLNPDVTLPSCAQIATAPALVNSASTFVSLGDTSNIAAHTGYGTQLSTAHSIIEDGGHSCTFLLSGTKRTFTVSVAPVSPYDRSRIQSLCLSTFGSSGSSIGGTTMIYGGYTGSVHEVGLLLQEGIWLTGKVTNDGDYFPAVLQDVADTVHGLNI